MDQNLFVFYEDTTAAGIYLNDEKFGMLCGNHIYTVHMRAYYVLLLDTYSYSLTCCYI
jgi:hypothetical protein